MLYLLKSALCLAILLAFYHLVLEREKMHQFNRFYLLGSVLFSFLAPSFIIYTEAKKAIQTSISYVEKEKVLELSFFEKYVTIENIILTTYLVISLIFLIRFVNNLYHIISKIRTNEVVKSYHAKFVPVVDEIQPHTFWNYIFINKDDYSNQKIEEELFTHELAHVTQKHTVDVLLLEILQILFWFNPLFFLLKKAVQLNHEFLADDKVIASHQNIPRYQTLLLNKASWKNEYYLASNLNYSLTKKRLLMMKTQNSKRTIFLKKVVVFPLLAGLAFVFANRVEAQTKTPPPPKPVKIQVVEVGATDKEMKDYKNFIDGFKEQKSAVKKRRLAKYKRIYAKMTKVQKKSVRNYRELIPPPPKPIKVKEIKRDSKLPPPPKPIKIEVVKRGQKSPKPIKVKEVKRKVKAPKPVKVKIVEKKKKSKEELQEIIIEEIEEIAEEPEVVIEQEVKELKETLEEREIEVVEEVEERQELEEVIDVQEVDDVQYLRNTGKLTAKQLKKVGAKFYLNGKEISTKKAEKYFKYPETIKNMTLVKGKKGKFEVRIESK